MATVLIVEDQTQILALAQSLLEEEGYKTHTAPNVDDALVILAGPEPVDALFVDIILDRDMQAGIELAKRAVEFETRPQGGLLNRTDPNRPHEGIARAWGSNS